MGEAKRRRDIAAGQDPITKLVESARGGADIEAALHILATMDQQDEDDRLARILFAHLVLRMIAGAPDPIWSAIREAKPAFLGSAEDLISYVDFMREKGFLTEEGIDLDAIGQHYGAA